MYAKANLMGDTSTAIKITQVSSPGETKKLGRQVTPFDNELWKSKCEEIVTDILVSKFSKPKLKEYLLSLRGNIYEASPNDRILSVVYRNCVYLIL